MTYENRTVIVPVVHQIYTDTSSSSRRCGGFGWRRCSSSTHTQKYVEFINRSHANPPTARAQSLMSEVSLQSRSAIQKEAETQSESLRPEHISLIKRLSRFSLQLSQCHSCL